MCDVVERCATLWSASRIKKALRDLHFFVLNNALTIIFIVFWNVFSFQETWDNNFASSTGEWLSGFD